MNDRRNRFIIPIIVLLCIVTLGVVYAATAGILNFNGTAVVNPNARVVFDNAEFVHSDQADTVNILQDAGQTISFTVNLDDIGDFATISVRLRNTGNVPVVMGELTDTTSAPTGITVTWPNEFNNIRIEPGQATESYTIRVEWTSEPTLQPESYTFSGTLSYAQAM